MGMEDETDWVRVVDRLRVATANGKIVRHQALVLLWAIGRARSGASRLVQWTSAREELQRLLLIYGLPESQPSPEYPFVALYRTVLWELVDFSDEVPPAHGSGVLSWLSDQDPRGGLALSTYEVMASDVRQRERVVAALLNRFFPGEDASALLHEVGLDEPEFDGFGLVPGIPVGAKFPDRRAVAAAEVHRPLQAGICGTKELGAESIVVSGGYEDDLDEGDVIVYTGQGGQDRNHRQIEDQQLTRGNAALATSHITQRPVRVVRGYAGDPTYSPKSGYSYDGLFLVESHWSQPGRSGFKVWRYRLRALDTVAPALTPPPTGTSEPGRRETAAERVIRSALVAEWVKNVHKHKCQVCGKSLDTPAGLYAETAHIQPLGRPHNGPDIVNNALCLCPNHHKLFDLGALTIDDDRVIIEVVTGHKVGKLREVPEHSIDPVYLAYHRNHH